MQTDSRALVLFLLLAVPSCSDMHRPPLLSTDEIGLRRTATHRVVPAYPAKSVASRSAGVAVLSISVRPDGTVSNATALQAPDANIAAEARRAALQWRFVPPTVDQGGNHTPACLDSKLTFYFEFDRHGRPHVTEPPSAYPPSPSGGPTGNVRAASVLSIDQHELDAMSRQYPLQVIDIRDRGPFAAGHRAGAINVPLDEVPIRFRTSQLVNTIVIDCYAGMARRCEIAADVIRSRKAGVSVAVLRPSF